MSIKFVKLLAVITAISSYKQHQAELVMDTETTNGLTSYKDVEKFAKARQRNAEIDDKTTEETQEKVRDSKLTKKYMTSPRAETQKYVEETSQTSQRFTSENLDTTNAKIYEDHKQRDVEANLIGIIKPPIESLDVAVSDEFIYVLSHYYTNQHTHLILVFDNNHPFDLLMIIPLEDVYLSLGFLWSKESNCLYISGIARNRHRTIWKVSLDDHRVTEWMSYSRGMTLESATNDGGVLMLKFNGSSLRIEMYDRNARFLKFYTPPINTGWLLTGYAAQEPKGNILIYEMSDADICCSVKISRLNIDLESVTEQALESDNTEVLWTFNSTLGHVTKESLIFSNSNGSCNAYLIDAKSKVYDHFRISAADNIETVAAYAFDRHVVVFGIAQRSSFNEIKIRPTWLTKDVENVFEERQYSSFCDATYLIENYRRFRLFLDTERNTIYAPSYTHDRITVLHSESLQTRMVINIGFPNINIIGYDSKTGHFLLYSDKHYYLMIMKFDID